MLGLKGIFETPRPDVGPAIAPESLPTVIALLYAPAVEVSTTSFPSGHAVAATVIWTMFALESDVGTQRQRLFGAAAMVVLVGFARVGAGVHFPIDVLVGTVAGICYLLFVLTVRHRVRARHGDHAAASATVTIAAVLAAFWTSGRPDTMALFGGCLGCLLAWQYATPSREPWPLTLQVGIHATVGIAALALVALVLLVVESLLVWLAVGLAGGLLVVGLPRLSSRTTVSRIQTELTS
ncbi:phosphatase PAP2 family protein [Natronorubrum sp. DTA28]|uniref:phosphatase PAP2 family protein n=1 Tax=Natronorubrum sp. DTA28 TaxID=3447019 RepID=UPI003F872E46